MQELDRPHPSTRVTKACDRCRIRRVRCEPVTQLASGVSRPNCKLCHVHAAYCVFTRPSRKRGPPASASRSTTQSSPSTVALESAVPPPISPISPKTDIWPARGNVREIPLERIDELVTIYFTHVHNLWPIIYKPLFELRSTSDALLLAMLAIASGVYPARQGEMFDSASLFAMAEEATRAIQHLPTPELAQVMFLLSLRQIGQGLKGMSYFYASQATAVVLSLGLDSAPLEMASMSREDLERRSRIFWCVYVLDKCMAEERGRQCAIAYRHCTTPLPSCDESDELEVWPPLPVGTASRLPGVRHLAPRRGHIMSNFSWMCRLAMIVEEILDQDFQGPPSGNPWDDCYKGASGSGHSTESIEAHLELWRQYRPDNLKVVSGNDAITPMPHCVINEMYFYSVKIQLYSKALSRSAVHARPNARSPDGGIYNVLHRQACTDAASRMIPLAALLERHSMLAHASSDIVHFLCLAMLVQVYDASSSDLDLALTARQRFDVCATWLKNLSDPWPAASASKMFFDAIIQGGNRFMTTETIVGVGVNGTNNRPNESSERDTRIEHDADRPAVGVFDPSAIYQLPQLYWNRMSSLMPLAGTQQDALCREDQYGSTMPSTPPDVVIGAWPQWADNDDLGGPGTMTPTDPAAVTEAFIQFILDSSRL